MKLAILLSFVLHDIDPESNGQIETMKAVSFMYVRPPGYDPESAKAAEYADDKHKGQGSSTQDPMAEDNVGSRYVDRNRYLV